MTRPWFQLTYRVTLAASLGVAGVLAAYRHLSPDGRIHTWLEPEYRRMTLRLLTRHVFDPRIVWSYLDGTPNPTPAPPSPGR